MIENLKNDMISCMKNHDKFRLTTLREIKGAMDLEHINKKIELSDDLLIDIVSKQIKLRQESIKEFEKGKRNDLIEKTNKELDILREYLPKQLTDEEVMVIINESFVKVNPTKPSDMGSIMRLITPLVKGKTDMGKIGAIVKEKLSSI